MGKTPINRFIDYFSKPLNSEQINYLNKLNGVSIEKTSLYRDFIISLIYLIHDTYLGEDVIITDKDRKSHFNWCWYKNIENFKKENNNILALGEHYYYLYNYVTDIYYNNSVKTNTLLNRIVDFWTLLMVIDRLKTKSEYDLFSEVYLMFDKYFFK